MTGFATGAPAKTTGPNAAVQGWYASFLRDVVIPNARTFSYLGAAAPTSGRADGRDDMGSATGA